MHRATFVCAAFLLGVTSRSLSAPLDCPDLLRPLDRLDARHLEGRWAMIAGSLSLPPLMERLRRRDSATLSFSSGASVVFVRQARVGHRCHRTAQNVTLEGAGFTHDGGNVTTTFVRTSCADCIVVSCDVGSGERRHFYLFSRRRRLEEREMEEFAAQVECLRMPPPVVMEPTEELCSEEPAADPTAPSQEETRGTEESKKPVKRARFRLKKLKPLFPF